MKTFVDNGMLLAYLQSRGLLAEDVSVSLIPTVSSSSSSNSNFSSTSSLATASTVLNNDVHSEEDMTNIRTARSNAVWMECKDKNATMAEAAQCFQRNMHLIRRLQVTLEQNIH